MYRFTRTNALDEAQDIPKAYEEMLNEIGYEARSDEQEEALHNRWEVSERRLSSDIFFNV